MARNTQADDEVISYEQFLKELEELKAWISRRPRPRKSWLWSVENWATGNR